MRAEDWERAEALFHRLAPLDAENRAIALAEISRSKPDLGAEVAALLGAHDTNGVFDRLTAKLAPEPVTSVGSAAPLTGARVRQYEIGELVGRGGMGDVYQARDTRLGRKVALKFLPAWLGRDPTAHDRFVVEARVVSAIDHPNVCTLYELGETDDGRLFIVMPLYEGETLKRRLARGALRADQAVEIGLQVARGLAAAHERGIVHRDIKPANLLLVADGRVTILDFGVAKLTDVSLTRPGERPGTERYMAPEQAAGEEADERSDLWSVGAVLYESLTGHRPPAERAARVAGLASHPPVLAVIVGRLLATEPGQRYPDARSLVEDLEVLAGAPGALAARPAPAFKRLLAELTRRHVFRVAAVYGAVGFGLLQVTDVMLPRLGLPDWTVTLFVWLVVSGFPVALVLAWAFESSRAGVRRTRPVQPAILDAIAAEPAGRRWPIGLAGAVGGVLLMIGAWLALGAGGLVGSRQQSPDRTVSLATPGAEPGVVVLPFRVVGNDISYLREGVVDLMSIDFDGAPGLRKIHASSTMTVWNDRVGNGRDAASPRDALDVARALGAAYAVLGSVVQVGPGTVRLQAEAYDVDSGAPRGSARMQGSADSLAQLIDGLTLELLRRGLIPTDGGYASPNLRRVTTASLPALKAFLAGESAYRRGNWEKAADHFREAVERDSLFARAWYRLGMAVYWWARPADEYFRRAAELAAGLPERDSLLFTAPTLPEAERLEALTRFTAAFPDDPDGWFMLGDGIFHAGGPVFRPASDYIQPLRRASVLAPSYEETSLHLFEDAFLRYDRERVDDLIRLTAADDPSASPCGAFALLRDMRWGSEMSARRSAARFDSTYHVPDACAWTAVVADPRALETAERRDLRFIERDASNPSPARLWRMVHARVATGHLRRARELPEIALQNEALRAQAAQYALTLDLSPFATDAGWPRRADAELRAAPRSETSPQLTEFWLAVEADEENQPRAFAESTVRIDSIADDVDGTAEARIATYARALEAYRALQAHDFGQLEAFETAMAGLDPDGWATSSPSQYLRFQVGRTLLSASRYREAERYFRSLYPYSWYFVPAQLELGRTYERLGEPELARERYRIFAEAWATADSDFQPLVEEARAAIDRLR